MSVPYTSSETDRPTYPDVEAEFGEDPARYLAVDENDEHDDHPLALAHARIKAIDDVAYIKEWQRIEAEHWGRAQVMKHLNARERELTNTEPVPDPETADPVAATDGGERVSESRSSSEETSDVGRTPIVDDVHRDVHGLAAGEVLVLERSETTEYVFPATPEFNLPYLLRTFDAEGTERTSNPIGLTFEEVRNRTDGEDPQPVGSIDVRPPELAASNGGETQ